MSIRRKFQEARMIRGFLIAATVACLATCSAAEEAGGTAGFYEPNWFETMPGVRFYLFQEDALWQEGLLSVERHATSDCLTPPVALEFSFPAINGHAGTMNMYLGLVLPGQAEGQPLVPQDVAGVSFWVKGDGSTGTGLVEVCGEERASPGYFEFSLGGKGWRRIFFKWADLTPPADAKAVAMVGFGLKEGSPRPARYVVDALRFEKGAGEDAALATLAVEAGERKDDGLAIPVRPSPSACCYNKGGLARTRAKIAAGEETKWLVYGDSVTVPVQLWNIPESLHRTRYAYYAVAAASVEETFETRVTVAVDAVGGRYLNEDFGSLGRSLAAERPDALLIMAWDSARNYELFMPRVMEAAAAAGAEVLVIIPAYETMPLREPAFDWLRRWAVENGVACADARSYVLGVPEVYWGDFVANPNHPNVLGHRLIGQVVAEMFR